MALVVVSRSRTLSQDVALFGGHRQAADQERQPFQRGFERFCLFVGTMVSTRTSSILTRSSCSELPDVVFESDASAPAPGRGLVIAGQAQAVEQKLVHDCHLAVFGA